MLQVNFLKGPYFNGIQKFPNMRTNSTGNVDKEESRVGAYFYIFERMFGHHFRMTSNDLAFA